jgi:hypothetical protein
MDVPLRMEDLPPGRHWFARAVLGFDAWLRRRNGVYEYSNHPQCAFRMQIVYVREEILLADGTHLRPGDRIIELHIWNEQFPRFSPSGATLSWARQVSRCVDTSLRELARHLAAAPDLTDVRAIRADTRLADRSTTPQLLRICRRFGLQRGPDLGRPSLSESLRRLGENIFIALLVLARNAGAFRPDRIWRDRVQMFLPRADLERRYGPVGAPETVGILPCEDRISVSQSLLPSPRAGARLRRPIRLGKTGTARNSSNPERSLSCHTSSGR